MLRLFLASLAQLLEPPVRKVVLASVLLSLLALVGLCGAVWALLSLTRFAQASWLDWLIDIFGGLAIVGLSVLVFPAVVGIVSSLFLETVVRAVEDKHYPRLPPTREQPFAEATGVSGRAGIVNLVLNLLALPLYVLFAWLPPVSLALFYALNGYLLAKEYHDMVALRRVERGPARARWRADRGRLFVGGVMLAALLSVPLVNLLTPVVATAFMVHLFHQHGSDRTATRPGRASAQGIG
ncbi:MAG: EI24 domain-containing protein [Alphaproteobacteria bacterium]